MNTRKIRLLWILTCSLLISAAGVPCYAEQPSLEASDETESLPNAQELADMKYHPDTQTHSGDQYQSDIQNLDKTNGLNDVQDDTDVPDLSAQSPPGWNDEMIGASSYAGKIAQTDMNDNMLIVAVLDSGIDPDLPQFKNRLFLPEDYVLIDEADTPTPGEFHHGTAAAGIIASLTASLPNIIILPVKVSCSDMDAEDQIEAWSDGVRYAVSHGADVINMSLGGSHYESLPPVSTYYDWIHMAAQDAISQGVIVCAPAGNEGTDAYGICPAHIDGVITCSALDQNREYSDYSNYGSPIDFCLPGTDISVLLPGGGTETVSGTSFSCAHLSALCAMIKLIHPDYNCEAVKRILRAYCTDLGEPGWDMQYGYGLPDMNTAEPYEETETVPDKEDLERIEYILARESFGEIMTAKHIDGFQCDIRDDEIMINGLGYDYKITETLTFPSELEYEGITYPVTAINAVPFNADVSRVKSVIIPKGVKQILFGAFEEYPNLTSVALPEGLTEIEDCAFRTPLLKKIYVPRSVTKIGEEAFGFSFNRQAMASQKTTGFVVVGFPGSAAEEYARKNNLTFKSAE